MQTLNTMNTKIRENLTKEQTWAQAYDVGFSDGYRSACCECWALGYDEATKEVLQR